MNYDVVIVNPDQISRLNQLSWDKRRYITCFNGDDYYLSVEYKFNDDVFRYKVICPNKEALELLKEKLMNKVQ